MALDILDAYNVCIYNERMEPGDYGQAIGDKCH
jgi:hypothetical protein